MPLFVFAHEQPQESGTIPVIRMSTSANGHHQPEDQPGALLHLHLAGLLPDNQKLVINSSARTAILFAQTSLVRPMSSPCSSFLPMGCVSSSHCFKRIRTIAPMRPCLQTSSRSRSMRLAGSCARSGRSPCVRFAERLGVLPSGCAPSACTCGPFAVPAIWWKPSPKRPLENRGARSKPCFSVKEYRWAKTMSREKTRHCS